MPCHGKPDDTAGVTMVLLWLHRALFLPHQELMLLVSSLANTSAKGNDI